MPVLSFGNSGGDQAMHNYALGNQKYKSAAFMLIADDDQRDHANRDWDFPYKIDHADLCFRLFTEAGFEWGGDWTTRKDYQHFEWIE